MDRWLLAGWLPVMASCGGVGEDETAGAAMGVMGETAETAELAAETATEIVAGISAETLLAETMVLSSDEFEGRAPGSAGEELTVDYLIEQFSAAGVAPGNPDGTWVQDVPLVGITPLPPQNLVVSDGAEALTLDPSTDYVAATRHVVDAVAVDGAEFVFVGYGARAPEYDWDDFGDADLGGKILLFLVNDPPLDDIFGGPAMTYYGRWMYKHEIAAELGAAGSLSSPRSKAARLRMKSSFMWPTGTISAATKASRATRSSTVRPTTLPVPQD